MLLIDLGDEFRGQRVERAPQRGDGLIASVKEPFEPSALNDRPQARRRPCSCVVSHIEQSIIAEIRDSDQLVSPILIDKDLSTASKHGHLARGIFDR